MKRLLWLAGAPVIALAALLVVLASCAAEATPTPTPRPPTPTSTPRPPTPTPTPLPPGVTPTPLPPTPTPVPKTPEQVRYEEALKEFALIEAAARKEGTFLIYTGSPGWDEWPFSDVVDLFKKRYPEIKPDGIRLGPAPTLERFRAETATGKHLADLYWGGYTIQYTMIGEGHMQNYVPPILLDPSIPWNFHPKIDGMDFPTAFSSLSVSGVLVNTRLIPEGQEPKCYADLRDPEWKGNIIAFDPTIAAGQYPWLYLWIPYGEQFVRDMLANVVLVTDAREPARAVARGDYPFSASGGISEVLEYAGAPIKSYRMCEGVGAQYFAGFLLLKGAPHPNAAKVFMNFYFSKEAQEIDAQVRAVARADVKVTNPLLDPDQRLIMGRPLNREDAEVTAPKYRAWATNVLKEMGKK